MHIARTLLSAAALLAAALTPGLLQAQTPAPTVWSDIVAAAKKEGSVQLYSTHAPEQVDRIKAAFKKHYPEIEVQFARLTTAALVAKIEQERTSSADGGDLAVHGDLQWFLQQASNGRLIPPTGPATKDWPTKGLRSGSVVLGAVDPLGLAYNSQRVTTPPANAGDVFRPEFKGKLGMSDIVSPNIVALYDWLEEKYGGDFLVKIKEQNPKLYTGAFPGAQSVASGEIVVNAYSIPAAVYALAAKGAPIKFIPSGIGAAFWMGVPKWSKRPNAAQVFLDFMMSREGQEAWDASGESASVLPDVKNAHPYIEPYDSLKYTNEYMTKYRERWSKVFK